MDTNFVDSLLEGASDEHDEMYGGWGEAELLVAQVVAQDGFTVHQDITAPHSSGNVVYRTCNESDQVAVEEVGKVWTEHDK